MARNTSKRQAGRSHDAYTRVNRRGERQLQFLYKVRGASNWPVFLFSSPVPRPSSRSAYIILISMVAMSLPTPPSTSHRDKENRLPPGSRISWSQHNEYHCLATSPPPKQPPKPSGSRSPPTKSILKKSTYVLLPFADDNDNEMYKRQREVTPEPADPLTNLSYLASSVDKIVASDDSSSLRDLIEAYSVLTARLKNAVNGTTDADASWPLFQPLRRHRDAVIRAFIRDLGRALVNPDAECEERRVSLPSPQSSPKRKKGMSAEQVKYARDLCTTSHAVIKLLGVVFTLPAIYRVFTGASTIVLFILHSKLLSRRATA